MKMYLSLKNLSELTTKFYCTLKFLLYIPGVNELTEIQIHKYFIIIYHHDNQADMGQVPR